MRIICNYGNAQHGAQTHVWSCWDVAAELKTEAIVPTATHWLRQRVSSYASLCPSLRARCARLRSEQTLRGAGTSLAVGSASASEEDRTVAPRLKSHGIRDVVTRGRLGPKVLAHRLREPTCSFPAYLHIT